MYAAPTVGAVLLLAVLLAAVNASFVSYTVNGEAVSGHEFLLSAGVAFAALGALSLAIAFGIWRERVWTRYLILVFWAVVVAANIGLGWAQSRISGVLSAVAGIATVLLLVGWYLFGKENVVEYYRALERGPVVNLTRDPGGKGGV